MRIEIQKPTVTSLHRLSGIDRAAPLMGRVIADRYLIDGMLGRGATSVVCRATRLGDGAPLAIKVLSPLSAEFLDAAVADRFRFEAQILSELHHPNIVSVFDFGTTEDGLLYTVMERLEGETLRTVLSLSDRLEPSTAVRIASAVAAGLQLLHERGLVHRDVKPANVFVGTDAEGAEVVKLLDLGLARVFDVPAEFPAAGDLANDGPLSEIRPRRRMSTEEGLIIGTGPYMSPEQIQGAELDARSDVYALGVVTYRMLTGTLPFIGSDLPHLLSLHLNAPAESMLDRAPSAALPPALDRVVLRALEKDPLARHESVHAFAGDLSAALIPEASASLPEDDAADAQLRIIAKRRRTARWIAAGTLVVAGTLAAHALVVHAAAHPSPAARMPEPPRHAIQPVESVPAPWKVVVGTAVLNRAPAPSPASTHSAAPTPSPRPIQRPPIVPEAPLDDLKVPVWRSRR